MPASVETHSVRLRIALAPALARALSLLATREDRTAEAQARRLLEDGLVRAGVLEPLPDPVAVDGPEAPP